MHSQEARKDGETEQRLYVLDAWRETSLFNERERAALAWTEALTLIAQTHAPDDVYAVVNAQFSDAEIANLTLLIGTINFWNRLAIGVRMPLPAAKAE
jgi:alkylhydroperoxidase family enzyme